jgi:hypothetical protein
MQFLRVAANPWGQQTVTGASWDLLWWFVGAAVAFIVLHAAFAAFARTRRRRHAVHDERSVTP